VERQAVNGAHVARLRQLEAELMPRPDIAAERAAARAALLETLAAARAEIEAELLELGIDPSAKPDAERVRAVEAELARALEERLRGAGRS
jgi:non-ribosomal peptide synthetase component F